MTCEDTRQRLDDYVDGALPPSTRAHVEAHLALCAGCRSELEATRDLLRRAAALRQGVAPARDLWPEIAGRLDPTAPFGAATSRRDASANGRWTAPLLAIAAALLLVALSLPLASRWLAPAAPPSAPLGSLASARRTPAFAELARSEDAVRQTHRDLQQAIARQREDLPPGTLRDIETSARLLDEAIGQLRAALGEYPRDPSLRHQLAARYQQESSLLKRVSRITRV